jgi:hypothetical protein
MILEALNESGAMPEQVQMIDSTVIRAHHLAAGAKGGVIIPFFVGVNSLTSRGLFQFCFAALRVMIGVMPPIAMLGRSLLYVHSHRVA